MSDQQEANEAAGGQSELTDGLERLPCPFCNGDTTGFVCVQPAHHGWRALVCVSCWAQGPRGKTDAEAVENWNRALRSNKEFT